MDFSEFWFVLTCLGHKIFWRHSTLNGRISTSHDLDSFLRKHLILDHAVQIYKNSHPVIITFSIAKYQSETLGRFLRKLRSEERLEQ